MEWMDFIMPASKKINRFLALMCFCFLNVAYAEAGEFNTNIENARLIVDNDGYKLNANINFNLSPIAVEALQNSIALVWNIRFRLYRQRSYLWDEKILEYTQKYQVRYHALLNMYQVKNETSGEVRRFFSQFSAFKAMGEIRNLVVAQRDEIVYPENISAALKVQFDREALPLPLRPVAYFDSQWYLSSDWLQWPVQK